MPTKMTSAVLVTDGVSGLPTETLLPPMENP